ncbi:MAG: carotenoid biosynthesis protein [Myxococcota bacterium]|nr:carotenoid biosynthesis protein [Myxococcota bacterium]
MESMRVARGLLWAHGAAVAFALVGLLIAIPHPQIWQSIPGAGAIFRFGIEHGGPVHIVLGAAAMLAFGAAVLGWGRTAVFFLASTGLSLVMELLGTGTGWPFGAYEYTAGLGYKILDKVPFSIPLSWFYMGLASYLLAQRVLERWLGQAPTWAVVALGAWLLTAWDLALDPAMAHPELPMQFWTWHQTGPYMGMPLINFAGWTLTGVLFMGVSRVLWRRPPPPDMPSFFPFAVYGLNMLFAVALSASVSLWLPIVLALVLGMAPACLVAGRGERPGRPAPALS